MIKSVDYIGKGLVKRAVRNRVYTGKTHLRGFQILDFFLVRADGLCLYSRDF